jgi:peptide/nickel transport system permease protein
VLRFIVSRLVSTVGALFVLTVVTFVMVRLMPGDVVTTLTGIENVSDEARERITREYGLDQPLPVQYLRWLSHVVQGDLGRTALTGQPVASVLAEKIVPSLQIAILAVMVSVVVAVSLGTLAAVRRGRLSDRFATLTAIVGTSLPDFVVGLLLIVLLARTFGLATFGYEPLSEGFLTWARHIVLPVLALSLGLIGLLTRLTKTAVRETLQQEYVRTARSKGVHGWRLLWRHILRPSLIPVITSAGLQLVAVIGGVVVIEVVFSIPGMGKLIFDALRQRDYAVIQAATLAIGCVAVAVSLLVDVIYRQLDPRLRR